MARMKQPASCGEVIYTSTAEIIGQCVTPVDDFAYGSFVIAGKNTACVGVIYNLETTSIDSNRRPLALGYDEEDLPQVHPHLSGLLRFQFHALLIGCLSSNEFQYGLHSAPPSLHAQVLPCTSEQVRQIALDLGFLRLIASCNKSPAEELLISTCRNLITAMVHELDGETRHQEILRLGKAVCDLYKDDYDSLRRIMERLETWMV